MSNLPESEMTAHDGVAVGGQPFHDLDVLAQQSKTIAELKAEIAERDRTYLAVQRAEGLERDRLAAALEETAARLEAHQHIMCSECEGIRLFVASALDAEAWE